MIREVRMFIREKRESDAISVSDGAYRMRKLAIAALDTCPEGVGWLSLPILLPPPSSMLSVEHSSSF